MAKPKSPPLKKSATPEIDPDDLVEDAGSGDDDEDDPGAENRRVNAVVTSRLKRELRPFQKMILDLATQIEALKNPVAPEGDEDDDDEEHPAATPARRKAGPESKKLTALERRVKDAEDRAAKAELAQKDQEGKSRRSEENVAVSQALAKAGVTDQKVIRAITLSLREDDLISRDEETGKVRFKLIDKYGSEDFVDPDSGVAKWIKSDGKVFLPALPASGSGAGSQATANPAGGVGLTRDGIAKLSKVERARIEIERASSGLPPLES